MGAGQPHETSNEGKMRKFVRGFFLAAAIGLTGIQSATAQFLPLEFIEYPAADLVKAAFAEPYGKLLTGKIVEAIRASAAPSCPQASAPQVPLETRVVAILHRRGTQIVGLTAATIDRAAFRRALAAKIGAAAVDEREQLKSNPLVQQYTALAAPLDAALAANFVVENLQLYTLTRRITFARPFPAPYSGDDKLYNNADPTDEVIAQLNKFKEDAKSPHLDRYIALTEAAQEALDAFARTSEPYKKRSPSTLVGGFDTDLAELCMKVR
jgi:hypothetical protein